MYACTAIVHFRPHKLNFLLLSQKVSEVPKQRVMSDGNQLCDSCEGGVGVNKPIWPYNAPPGERRYMCGQCRDALIIKQRQSKVGRASTAASDS
jgi:predicted SprT family Zn-dependent metalloprotease